MLNLSKKQDLWVLFLTTLGILGAVGTLSGCGIIISAERNAHITSATGDGTTDDATPTKEVCTFGQYEIPCDPVAAFVFYLQNQNPTIGFTFVSVPSAESNYRFPPVNAPLGKCVHWGLNTPKDIPPTQTLEPLEGEAVARVSFQGDSAAVIPDVLGAGLDLYGIIYGGNWPYSPGQRLNVTLATASLSDEEVNFKTMRMPGAISNLQLQGSTPPSSTTTNFSISKAQGMHWTWESAPYGGGNAKDQGQVIFTINTAPNGSGQKDKLECIVEDTGDFTVTPQDLAQLENFSSNQYGSVSVRKVAARVITLSNGKVILQSSDYSVYEFENARTSGTTLSLTN